MSEASLWTNLRKKMVPDYWPEATRHEDAYQRGIADVSFVQPFLRPPTRGQHGWMELKWRARWPARIGTNVSLPHYHDDQRKWLMKKGEAGGMTFLFLQVERDYLLFDYRRAQHVGLMNTADTLSLANLIMYRKLDPALLSEAIKEYG